MFSSGKTRRADGRCEAVSQDGIDFVIRKFTSDNARQSPCLDGVPRRKRISSFKETDRFPPNFRPWTLSNGFDDLNGNRSIGESFDPESPGVSRPRVVAGFAHDVEGAPKRIQGIRRAQTRRPDFRNSVRELKFLLMG